MIEVVYDGGVALRDSLALHSLNPKYTDIVISPELPLRVLGKVMQ